MKRYKFILILAVLFGIASGVAFAYDEGSQRNTKLAHPGLDADPVRVITLVRYAESAQNELPLSAGDVVLWDCLSDDGVTVGLLSSINSRDAVAGVAVGTIPTAEVGGFSAANDAGKRNWGYIQIEGLCTFVNIAPTSGVAGSALIASPTARCATTSTATLGPTRVLGFAYDASSTGQSEVLVDVR